MQHGFFTLALTCDGKPLGEHQSRGAFPPPVAGPGDVVALGETFTAPTRMEAKAKARDMGWFLTPPADGRAYCAECRAANRHPRDRRRREPAQT